MGKRRIYGRICRIHFNDRHGGCCLCGTGSDGIIGHIDSLRCKNGFERQVIRISRIFADPFGCKSDDQYSFECSGKHDKSKAHDGEYCPHVQLSEHSDKHDSPGSGYSIRDLFLPSLHKELQGWQDPPDRNAYCRGHIPGCLFILKYRDRILFHRQGIFRALCGC